MSAAQPGTGCSGGILRTVVLVKKFKVLDLLLGFVLRDVTPGDLNELPGRLVVSLPSAAYFGRGRDRFGCTA